MVLFATVIEIQMTAIFSNAENYFCLDEFWCVNLGMYIDRFQSRDHFTIGRHIGAHVNSELVSREL